MLICGPFHSVCNPPVGMAYLRSYLEGRGIPCETLDLNILSRRYLSRIGVRPEILDLLYSQSCRTYIAEAMVWSWHDEDGAVGILERIDSSRSDVLRHFWYNEGVRALTTDPEIMEVSRLLQGWLLEQINALATHTRGWVGFSTTITNLAANLFMARQMKQNDPDLLVLIGGPEVTHRNSGELLASFPYVDAAIPAPAYQPLADLLTDPRSARSCSCAGVWLRDRSAGIVGNGQIREIDLDELPPADWRGFDLDLYVPGFIIQDPVSVAPYYPIVPLHTSQGCSYNECNFCYNTSLYSRFAAQSPHRVLEEIKHQIASVESRGFFFTDFEFNALPERVSEICRLIGTMEQEIRFYVWLRIDKLDQYLLDTLYAAGCRQVFLGVEAIDDHLLCLMNKGYNARTAVKKLQLLHDFWETHPDFHFEFNLIADYPGETLVSVKNTLGTVLSFPHLFYRRIAAVVDFMLHEGTPAFQTLGPASVGCMSPIFPRGAALRSYRHLISSPPDPEYKDRLELWSAIRSIGYRKS